MLAGTFGLHLLVLSSANGFTIPSFEDVKTKLNDLKNNVLHNLPEQLKKFNLTEFTHHFNLTEFASHAEVQRDVNASDPLLQVHLDQGIYQGFRSKKGKSWLGIPFAQPPVGSLRFRPPVKVATSKSSRNVVHNSTQWANGCVGRAGLAPFSEMSEDCLYLNVFTPDLKYPEISRLPVLVWVFGSAFNQGNSQQQIMPKPYDLSMYDGQNIISVDERAIIVTFNYRVGPLGFLSSQQVADEGSLNAGLLDQKLAFEWVRKNIAQFGGDPNRVTAIGCSAGAMTIGTFLLAEDGNQKLFDRAIMLSGPAPLSLLSPSSSQVLFDDFSSKLNCSRHQTKRVMDCLRKVDAHALNDASLDMTFFLTADESYLKRSAFHRMDRFSKVPILVSTAQDETSTFTSNLFSLVGPRNTTIDEASLPSFEQFFSGGLFTSAQVSQVRQLYKDKSAQDSFNAFLGDWNFKCPASRMAKIYSDAGVETLFTRWKHVPYAFRLPWLNHSKAFHGSDVVFFWQVKYVLFPNEWNLAIRVARAYIDFASGKKPFVNWKTYNGQEGNVYDMDSLSLEPDSEVDSEACKTYFKFISQ